MYSKLKSAALLGIQAEPVDVEVDSSIGFPSFTVVGLPDTAVKESRERIRTAMTNAGMAFPDRRVTVNMAPADIRKEGTHFDLPIALSILLSSGMNSCEEGKRAVYLGELALDGRVVRIKGLLPMILSLRDKGYRMFVVPEENKQEGSIVDNVSIYCVGTLQEAADFLSTGHGGEKTVFQKPILPDPVEVPDFAEVQGQDAAKRALQIAAAGMHNILMTGSPGSGKTMLARRLPGILPPLTYEESLEITKIYSLYGMLDESRPLITRRPFRSPDHTVTTAALIGGGRRIRAGEVSLAHMGVLFLDEIAEFSRDALESLRRPMSEDLCVITRLSGSVTLPSKFLTVAAMNPCPCGYYLDSTRMCRCTESQVRKYRRRLSGPFLDRIDLCITVAAPCYDDIIKRKKSTSSAKLKEKVMTAFAIQSDRFQNDNIHYNSQMQAEQISRYCRRTREAENLLQQAFEKYTMSARSYYRTLRVARTIADMEEKEEIDELDVAEAVSYKIDPVLL